MNKILGLPYRFCGLIYRATRSVVMGVLGFLLDCVLVPYHLGWYALRTMPVDIYKWVLGLGRFIFSIPTRIIRSPVQSYRALIRGRNWMLAKVEYLQSESQKWKTAFNIVKAPYSLLRLCGLSPNMAATFLVAGSVAGGGIVANEVLEGRSFARGDSGVYTAPLDAPVQYTAGNNTLRVDLGSTPVGLLEIDSVTVGTAYANSALPSGETNVVFVGGLPATSSPVFAETYLEVGHLIVDRWRCTQLKLDTIEVFELIVRQNASDGQSIAPVAGTPRARGIGGGNRADAMVTSGGYYDQIKISAASTGQNGYVDVMRLTNIYTKGGPCVISRVKAGIIEIVLNESGAGDGFATKDFIIATSVIYKTFLNEDNVEVSISPPS